MPEEDLRQRFLDVLSGGHQPAPSPAAPPAEAPAPDAAGEAPPAPPTPPAAPLSFEQAPPPPADVPPAMSALASEAEPAAPAAASPAPAGADLMDLGHDAQLQGTALSLHSLGQQLQVISEGLKLIPALKNIGQHLEQLNYPEVAAAVEAVAQWAAVEEQALYQTLEERRVARAGEPSGGNAA